MKIVNLVDFLAMPPGTVFAKYQPYVFEELMIKADSVIGRPDFYRQIVMEVDDGTTGCKFNEIIRAENGVSVNFDLDGEGRDGGSSPEQLFAVYESRDVEQLIARLQRALVDSGKG